ncbi:MAG: hypothetical protein ONB13_01525 [candidate division KSB1 bacterium]|nr:hypothetical protein [candidate division KSB1 bacterium]
MKGLLLVFYNIIIPLLLIGAHIVSLFHAKIRKGLKGRRAALVQLNRDLSSFAHRPRVLIHVSSFGEWLQVKPVLLNLKQLCPEVLIVVSFFSPSGFDHVAIEPPIDVKCYLPIDSYFRMKKFVEMVMPRVAAIVRHDIWPNFLCRLKREKIPVVLIDASEPERSRLMSWCAHPFNRWIYPMFDRVLAISDLEAKKLRRWLDDPQKINTTGDTKYDQVFQRSQQLERIAQISRLPALQTRPIWVVGSSWPADESYIIPAFKILLQQFRDLILILVPHEPGPARLEQIERQLHSANLTGLRLSQLNDRSFHHHCLIVDRVGLLATIYSLGKIAFVGGSFHFKIHNVLEPAVFGIPILFGPKMNNSAEAIHLLANNAAILVKSTDEIVATITRLMTEPEIAQKYGERARQIVLQNVGSSIRVAEVLKEFLDHDQIRSGAES